MVCPGKRRQLNVSVMMLTLLAALSCDCMVMLVSGMYGVNSTDSRQDILTERLTTVPALFLKRQGKTYIMNWIYICKNALANTFTNVIDLCLQQRKYFEFK